MSVIAMNDAPYVTATDIRMKFGSVKALVGAEIAVKPGTIEGLVGHNGAGKSTLISTLCGALVPDAGTVIVRGEALAGGGIQEAERRGIVLVPQRTSLFADASVLDNLLTPRRWPTRGAGLIDWRSARAAARRAMQQVALSVDLNTRVAELPMHERRALMIARGLLREPGLLILDEPTEAFSEREVAQLFEVVRNMVADGMTVIYVSHRLDEVLDLASNVTIMRDGATVGRVSAADCDRHELVKLMLGDDMSVATELETIHRDHREQVTPVISVDNMAGGRLAGVSFDVRPGEIVGLYGLAGAGQGEILQAVAGLHDYTGEVRLHGELVKGSVGARRGRGLSMVSADVAADASLPGLTVRENVVIGVSGGVRKRQTLPFVSRSGEVRLAQETLDRVGLGRDRIESRIETLSGGMQQKVMLARSLVNRSCVWLMDEPMTGLDIHSRLELVVLMRQLVAEHVSETAQSRAAVVVLSDYADLAMMCDRVCVVRDGRVVAEYHAGDFDEHTIVHAASFVQAA